MAGSHSGDDDPSMCSQKRTVLPPAAAMSRRAPSRMAWSSAGVCVYWVALEKGRNLTLPRLTPSMKKGLPSRVVTRLPAALGRAFAAAAAAAAAAGVTGTGAAAATCSISAVSEAEEAPFLAAKKLLPLGGGLEGELDFFARAGVEKAPAERASRARTSRAAAEDKSLRRSIVLRFRRLSRRFFHSFRANSTGSTEFTCILRKGVHFMCDWREREGGKKKNER